MMALMQIKPNVVILPKNKTGENIARVHGNDFCLLKTIKIKKGSWLIIIQSVKTTEPIIVSVTEDKNFIVKFK